MNRSAEPSVINLGPGFGVRTSCDSLSELAFTNARYGRLLCAVRGAIILAKINMHEFALAGTTVSSLGGQTLNAYDLTPPRATRARHCRGCDQQPGDGRDRLRDGELHPLARLGQRAGHPTGFSASTASCLFPARRMPSGSCPPRRRCRRLLKAMAAADPADPQTADNPHQDYLAALDADALVSRPKFYMRR
jgi:amidase